MKPQKAAVQGRLFYARQAADSTPAPPARPALRAVQLTVIANGH